jgi:hypothetical protein
MRYISNAFSLQMVAPENLDLVRFKAVDLEQHRLKELHSIVGHADIAAVLGIEMNRASVMLNPGDSMLVAQLVGGRLPEGCKTLPEGFRLQGVLVYLE